MTGELSVPSIANARHMRRADSGLFNSAVEASRNYVTASPCVNLLKLDAEHPRTRVLSEDGIRAFWHGPDQASKMRRDGASREISLDPRVFRIDPILTPT
ncbi:hypothetical protein ACRAVF_06600 [Bradyrhizobium oligotrophicum S58]